MSSEGPTESTQKIKGAGERDQLVRALLTNPALCLAKWKQVTIHLHNGNTQSCHHVKSHRVSADQLSTHPAALHNTPQKIETRRQMRAGDRPEECGYCWRAEDAGVVSDRWRKSLSGWAAPFLSEALSGESDESVIPTALEVSFDSVCNLKCMYCGPAYSTTWRREIEEHGPYPTWMGFNSLDMPGNDLPLKAADRQPYVDAFWRVWPKWVPHLHHFRITGGEPLLSEETFRVLEFLRGRENHSLIFSVNSNLSISEDRVQRLARALNAARPNLKKIQLHISLDTWGKQAEYIRFGLNLERFQKNLELILSEVPAGLRVSFMVTMNALSISRFDELVDFIADLRLRHPNHEIALDCPYLRHPAHLSFEVLPKSFANRLDRALMKMRDRGFSEGEILLVRRAQDLIRSPQSSFVRRWLLRADFARGITENDRRRGTRFADTFTEYRSLMRQAIWADWLSRPLRAVHRLFPGLMSFLSSLKARRSPEKALKAGSTEEKQRPTERQGHSIPKGTGRKPADAEISP
jgi:sulfatase maturation enzyme AslB (radical SAM superfamily)